MVKPRGKKVVSIAAPPSEPPPPPADPSQPPPSENAPEPVAPASEPAVPEPVRSGPAPAPAVAVKMKKVFDLTTLEPLSEDVLARASGNPLAQYLGGPPGSEAYTLLANVSKQLPEGSLVVDLSLCAGLNALALSCNAGVRVETTDTLGSIAAPANVTKAPSADNAPRAAVVCIDDSQYATLDFLDSLAAGGFEGLVVVDDINLDDTMRRLWTAARAKYTAIDATHAGHSYGTGLLVFGDCDVRV